MFRINRSLFPEVEQMSRPSKQYNLKFLVVLLALTLFLAACSQAPSEPTEPVAGDETSDEVSEEPTESEEEEQPASGDDEETVKLGVVLNLTTGMALYGTPMMNAVTLATEHQNAEGGINGKPIQLVVEDAADTATTGINALNRVLESEPIALVGPILGFQMLPFRDIVDEEQIPIISLSGTRGWTMNDNRYAFRTGEFDGNSKPALADFVVEELGVERIGIIVVANEWGHSGRDHVTQRLMEAHGIEPVIVETYQTTDTDMSAQLQNISNADVEVIVSQGHPQDTALVLKQAQQLGIEIPIVASSVAETAVNLDITQPEEVEGLYVQTYALPNDNPDPEIQAWTEEYIEMFDMRPDAYALAQYDGVRMLFQAMENADNEDSLTREGVTDAMWDITYDGLIATYETDFEGNMLRDYIIVQYGPDKTAEIVHSAHVSTEETIYEVEGN